MINIFFKTLTIFALSLFCSNFASSPTILEEIIDSGIISGTDPYLAKTVLHEFPSDKNLTLGYLALGEGTNAISDACELGSLSKWSHVAMILCNPDDIKTTEQDLKEVNKSKWFCFHSDVNLAGSGTQLIPWSIYETLKMADTAVSLRPFVYKNKAFMPTTEKLKEVIDLFNKNIKYEKFITELIASPFQANTVEDETSLFCSELVAAVLQDLDLLPNTPGSRLSNNFITADFSMERQSSLHLTKKVSLGNEIPAWPFTKTSARTVFESLLSTLYSTVSRCAIM